MFFHAVVMILLCLLLPLIAKWLVNPIVRELFGNSKDVLSMSVLATMAIMLVSVFIVPAVMFFVSRASRRELVQIYMKDRKSTRLNSSDVSISYAVFCLKESK